ncbi:MAG: hypothetical protein WD187_00320 [Candidatus Woykebacteria bacterium]
MFCGPNRVGKDVSWKMWRLTKFLAWKAAETPRTERFAVFPAGLRSVIRDYLEIAIDPGKRMNIPGTGYSVQAVVAVAVRRGFNVQEMASNELADLPKSKICAALRFALDDPHNGAFSAVRRWWNSICPPLAQRSI